MFTFTHHVDIQVLPSWLAAAAAAAAEVVVVAEVVAGLSPVPAARKRKMRRTWRRKRRSRVEERWAGTGSSGWAPPTGSSGRRVCMYFIKEKYNLFFKTAHDYGLYNMRGARNNTQANPLARFSVAPVRL